MIKLNVDLVQLPKRSESRVLLSDVMLYFFAKMAGKKECRLPLSSIYAVMSELESELEDLNIPVIFEKTGTYLYSQQIDKAVHHLIPFDIQIVNPGVSIAIGKEAANRRLKHLNRRLPDAVREKLDLMFDKFDNAMIRRGSP